MIFLLFCARLPLWCGYLCSDLLFFLLFYLLRYRRKVVDENLGVAFPKADKTLRKRMARSYYRHLSNMVFEVIKALGMSRAALQRRVSVSNLDQVLSYWKTKKPVVFYASHQGNWEWILAAGAQYIPWPVEAIVRPISSSFVEKLIYRLRNKRYGIATYSGQEAQRRLLQRPYPLRAYVITGDQCPQQGDTKHWTSFFGRSTPFFQGIERLPRLLEAPVFFLSITRKRRGYYHLHFEPLAVPPYPPYRIDKLWLLPRYARALEKAIQADPPYWLWSHRRWKYTQHTE